MFCCTLLYVHSSIAIILMGKRELIALLNLSSWCLVMVERLFLAVLRGCLQFVIVVFPDHTHLLFFSISGCSSHTSQIYSHTSRPLFMHIALPAIYLCDYKFDLRDVHIFFPDSVLVLFSYNNVFISLKFHDTSPCGLCRFRLIFMHVKISCLHLDQTV